MIEKGRALTIDKLLRRLECDHRFLQYSTHSHTYTLSLTHTLSLSHTHIHILPGVPGVIYLAFSCPDSKVTHELVYGQRSSIFNCLRVEQMPMS